MPRWFHSSCFSAELDQTNIMMAVLDLRHCNLTTVPSEIFKSKEGKTLEEVYLDANQLRDLPRALFNLQNLQILGLSDNELTILPSALSNLINLREVDFSKNGIIDVPDSIKNCKNLQEIDASVNPIGKIPDTFSQLLNLTHLYLNDAFLDFLPGNFGRLAKLKVLELRENHLKVLPKSMSHLTQLDRLDIGNNEFAELPVVVGCLLNLKELWMDSNAIRELRPEIGLLRQLMLLDISKNRLECLPPEIESLQSLTDLYLSNNLLIELPEQIGSLGKLQTLKLDENHLGELPDSIGRLQNLEEIVLTCNELVGLPSSLGFLRKLRVLNADENFLESIPSELGSCTAMAILSLRDNRLVRIPNDIGRMPNLQVINLACNRLECLPYSFHKLGNLKALWLSENQSKPMIPLQSDYDSTSKSHVLTCYMFPQEPLPEENTSMNSVEIHSGDEGTSNLLHVDLEAAPPQRSSIVFDIDENDYLARLARFSSPYPKDVKDRAAQYLASRRQHVQDSPQPVHPAPASKHHCHQQHRDQHHQPKPQEQQRGGLPQPEHPPPPHQEQQQPPTQSQAYQRESHPDPEPEPPRFPSPPRSMQLTNQDFPQEMPPPPSFREVLPSREQEQQQRNTPLQQLLLRGQLEKQGVEREEMPVYGVRPQGRAGDVPWYEEQSHDSSESGSIHTEQREAVREFAMVAPTRPIINGDESISNQRSEIPGRLQGRGVLGNLPRVDERTDTRSQDSHSTASSYDSAPVLSSPAYIPEPLPPQSASSYASSYDTQHSFREEAPSSASFVRNPPTGEWMRMSEATQGSTASYEEVHSFRSEEPSVLHNNNQPILRPPSYHEAIGQRHPLELTINHIYVDQLRPNVFGTVDSSSADSRFSPPPGYATIDPRLGSHAQVQPSSGRGTSSQIISGRQPIALPRPEAGQQQFQQNGQMFPSSPPDIERYENQVRQLQLERREAHRVRDPDSPVDRSPTGHGPEMQTREEPPIPPPPPREEDQFNVLIHKNPNLGFSVAGGAGSSGNPFDPADNTSIYVTKVQPEGPAAFGLKPGDKLLEVNGLNLRNVPHDRAVLFLKNNQVVNLLVARAKEDR